jgi:hypothetical protein
MSSSAWLGLMSPWTGIKSKKPPEGGITSDLNGLCMDTGRWLAATGQVDRFH